MELQTSEIPGNNTGGTGEENQERSQILHEVEFTDARDNHDVNDERRPADQDHRGILSKPLEESVERQRPSTTEENSIKEANQEEQKSLHNVDVPGSGERGSIRDCARCGDSETNTLENTGGSPTPETALEENQKTQEQEHEELHNVSGRCGKDHDINPRLGEQRRLGPTTVGEKIHPDMGTDGPRGDHIDSSRIREHTGRPKLPPQTFREARVSWNQWSLQTFFREEKLEEDIRRRIKEAWGLKKKWAYLIVNGHGAGYTPETWPMISSIRVVIRSPGGAEVVVQGPGGWEIELDAVTAEKWFQNCGLIPTEIVGWNPRENIKRGERFTMRSAPNFGIPREKPKTGEIMRRQDIRRMQAVTIDIMNPDGRIIQKGLEMGIRMGSLPRTRLNTDQE
jgi:hypothetical protein